MWEILFQRWEVVKSLVLNFIKFVIKFLKCVQVASGVQMFLETNIYWFSSSEILVEEARSFFSIYLFSDSNIGIYWVAHWGMLKQLTEFTESRNITDSALSNMVKNQKLHNIIIPKFSKILSFIYFVHC